MPSTLSHSADHRAVLAALWEWRTGRHGQPLAYATLPMTPPDLLRLGRLMLAGGAWQGR